MKLSEAILLGSTVLAPQAGGMHFAEKKSGCALGMAAVANGCTFRPATHFDPKDRRTLGTEGVWGTWVLNEVKRPCACWRLVVRREMRIKDIIAHLFDHHVMWRRDWTLEQLVEWVKSVEPSETAPPVQPAIVPGQAFLRWRERQAEAAQHEEEGREEAREEDQWLAVREAFASRHESKRTRPGHPR